MIFRLTEKNSIAAHFLAQLRDKEIQKDSMRFRKNLERIASLLAFEISKTLDYEFKDVETPLGIASCAQLIQPIVITSVLRAAQPMQHGMLEIFDTAESAFIAAYRHHHKSGEFEIKLEYSASTSLNNKTLIVCDPMLATGASAIKSIQSLLRYGTPSSIHLASVISSTEGIQYVQKQMPSVHIWTGDIDEELTAKGYIVPGLGDAGDLAFGKKEDFSV